LLIFLRAFVKLRQNHRSCCHSISQTKALKQRAEAKQKVGTALLPEEEEALKQEGSVGEVVDIGEAAAATPKEGEAKP